LQALWREHRRWVAAVLLAHMPREAELDDLLQEVAVSVVQRIGELKDPGRFRWWLRTVAVNAARSAGRKASVRRRTMRPLGAGDGGHIDGAAEREARRREAGAEANRALEMAMRLHPEYREPLLLRSVHGMTQRQIAEAMGVPETTVETRLARARRMLREEMEFESDLVTAGVARAAAAGPTKGAGS